MKDTLPQSTRDCLRDLVGLPYSAFDCYELARLFYRKVLDIGLEKLYEFKPEDGDAEEIAQNEKQKFIKVSDPEFGDLILIRHMGLLCHIGIYISQREFLHTQKGTGSIIDKLSRWEKRIEGYYRYA